MEPDGRNPEIQARSNFLEELPDVDTGVKPMLHCTQEIPCNPCSALCDRGLIEIDEKRYPSRSDLHGNHGLLRFVKCASHLPGLAVTLVDYRSDADFRW